MNTKKTAAAEGKSYTELEKEAEKSRCEACNGEGVLRIYKGLRTCPHCTFGQKWITGVPLAPKPNLT